MSSIIGQPLMGYPDIPGTATHYLGLGCGDTVSYDDSGNPGVNPGEYACPVHGEQVVVSFSEILSGSTPRVP